MAQDSERLSDEVSRRKFILGAGATGAAALAGCTSNQGNSTPTPRVETVVKERTVTAESSSADQGSSELSAEGSSTVYPISNTGGSYWNGNPPADDQEYWGPDQYGIDTDMNLADYFASLYGFEPTETRSQAPFNVSVGLSHSGTGCKSVRDGLVDIGNSSGPITAELGISDEKANENYVDHVVGRDGQPVVVSDELYDAGITKLTGEQVRKIYQDEITNWSEVGGPDQEIFCVGRAEGSGTDTAFRLNMLGDAEASMSGVDTRKGQNQQVKTVVQQNGGAIAYMALAFTGEQVRPIAIEFDGTTYEPNKDAEHTIYDSDYPLNRDLHMYTKKTDETPEGTSMEEAAFINMFLTEFGQETFVTANNYIPLPTKDIEAERAKLPDQV